MHKNTATAAIIQLVWQAVRLRKPYDILQPNSPPQSSLFGWRFDTLHVPETVHPVKSRLNLACLAVGSTERHRHKLDWQCRLNLACLAGGSTVTGENVSCENCARLNLACLAGGSTAGDFFRMDDRSPPQSSLFGWRFDRTSFARFWKRRIYRLNLACLAVGSTFERSLFC